MDEYEYKLGREDPILILNTIKAITDRIRAFHTVNNKIECTKLCKYLQDKCLHKNIAISTTSMSGIISLCENGEKDKSVLSLEKLLNDFMSALLHMSNTTSMIQLIFHAMERTDFSKYGIMRNQHPLITVVKKDVNSWPIILTKIQQAMEGDNCSLVLRTLQPFLLYALYDYEVKISEIFQQELFQLCERELDVGFCNKIILFSKPHIVRTLRYCQRGLPSNSYLLPPLILCLHEMMRNDIEVSEGINILRCHVNNLEEMKDFSNELYLITDCINIAPLIYLGTLLDICVKILRSFPCKENSVNVLKCALIKLKLNIAVNNSQTKDVLTSIDTILSYTYTTKPDLPLLDDVAETQFLDYRLYIVHEVLNGTLEKNSFNHLEECPVDFLLQMFDYLLSVLCYETSESVISKTLTILLMCCDKYPIKTTKLLPVLLYKITNCMDPQIILKLLHTLPNLAVLKENLPIILTTVKTISLYSPVLQTIAMSIFYELSCVDIQCFCYLQELLLKGNVKNAKEDLLAKAFVLKELCRKNVALEVYGPELTGYLSKILNSSQDEENSIPQALAFEGLKHLYRNDIIDIASVWESLALRYASDTRERVIKSLCEMLAEVSNETSNDPKYDKLFEDVIRSLWSYTMNSNGVIVKAAFSALGQFTLEQILLSLPEHYTNATRNVFGNIAGTAWIQVLHKCNDVQLSCATDMLRNMIAAEIRNYKKRLYDVPDGVGEPPSLDYLPLNSVVSALTTYLKRQVTAWQDSNTNVYLEILRLLSFKYSRPFPPMDWSFLQELMHDARTKRYCVTLASHQVMLTGSARRMIENYMVATSERKIFDMDIIYIYNCFEFLCNSIQPIIIKPFVGNTLLVVVSMVDREEKDGREHLQTMVDSLKIVLEDNGISDSNKLVISQEIISQIENLEYNSEAFDIMLRCSPGLPLKYLNDMSCPIQFEELDSTAMERCFKIRCVTAINCSGNPLVYLDTFIDSQLIKFEMKDEEQSNMTFSVLVKWLKMIFLKNQNSENCIEWLMELLAKIQLRLASRQDIQTVMFTTAVFIIAVIVLSGFYVFRINCDTFAEYSSCFPYALTCLLKTDKWSSHVPQVSEWLYDVSTNKNYTRSPHSDFIIAAFKASLLTLRNEEAFNENFKWMKYIEMDV